MPEFLRKSNVLFLYWKWGKRHRPLKKYISIINEIKSFCQISFMLIICEWNVDQRISTLFSCSLWNWKQKWSDNSNFLLRGTNFWHILQLKFPILFFEGESQSWNLNGEWGLSGTSCENAWNCLSSDTSVFKFPSRIHEKTVSPTLTIWPWP